MHNEITVYIEASMRDTSVVTLFDLSNGICRNLNLVPPQSFESLKMGSLIYHPSVQQHFSPLANMRQPPQITISEVFQEISDVKTKFHSRGEKVTPEAVAKSLAAKRAELPAALCVWIGKFAIGKFLGLKNKIRDQVKQDEDAYRLRQVELSKETMEKILSDSWKSKETAVVAGAHLTPLGKRFLTTWSSKCAILTPHEMKSKLLHEAKQSGNLGEDLISGLVESSLLVLFATAVSDFPDVRNSILKWRAGSMEEVIGEVNIVLESERSLRFRNTTADVPSVLASLCQLEQAVLQRMQLIDFSSLQRGSFLKFILSSKMLSSVFHEEYLPSIVKICEATDQLGNFSPDTETLSKACLEEILLDAFKDLSIM